MENRRDRRDSKEKKEKRLPAPNDCSVGRWILAAVMAILVGLVLSVPLNPYLENTSEFMMGISYANFFSIVTFIPFFVATIIVLKLVCKTSLKDFVLGVGGKLDKKMCLIVLGLYAVGFAIPYLLMARHIHLRGVQAGQYCFLLLFVLLTVWMQTTVEEFLFRGLFFRVLCKNNVGYTKKGIIAAVVSAVVFALFHVPNPEAASQKGILVVLTIFSYVVSGFVYALADLHFGNLIPGILIHWLNNTLLTTVISAEVSVVTMPTLLVESVPYGAVWTLGSTVAAMVPVTFYIIISLIKRKKAASASAQ